jgi:hypothetical protein
VISKKPWAISDAKTRKPWTVFPNAVIALPFYARIRFMVLHRSITLVGSSFGLVAVNCRGAHGARRLAN